MFFLFPILNQADNSQAGEQAIAEFEAEGFLCEPVRPISSAYTRVLGPTIQLWEVNKHSVVFSLVK